MAIFEGVLKTSLDKVEPSLLNSYSVGVVEWHEGDTTLTKVRAKINSGTAMFNLSRVPKGGASSVGWQWDNLSGSFSKELDIAWHFKAFDLGPYVNSEADNADSVTGWYSFDMNATLAQSNKDKRPEYYIGAYGPGGIRDAVAFDGVDDQLYISDGQSEFSGDWTMFVVLGHFDASESNNPIVARSDTTHPNEGTLYGKQGRQFIQDDGGNYYRSSTLTPDDDQIRCIQFDVSTKKVSEYVNGTAAYTGVSGPNGPFTFNSIGQLQYSGSTAENMTGAISEILMFNNHLDEDERQIFEGHLAYRYFLKGELPADHPYKVVNTFLEATGEYPNIVSTYLIPLGGILCSGTYGDGETVSQSINDGDRLQFYVPGCQNPGQITVELTYS